MAKKKSKYDEELCLIDIRGLSYKLTLYPKSLFLARYPNTLAQVEEEPFIMRFCEEFLTLNVIKHELFHCYMASCFLSTQQDIVPGDVEEVACDVFAYLSEDITKKALEIQKILEKEKKGRASEPKQKTRK